MLARRFGASARSRTVDIHTVALPALRPQASDAAVPVLSLPTCKTRVVLVPSPKRDREDAVGQGRVLTRVSCTQEASNVA